MQRVITLFVALLCIGTASNAKAATQTHIGLNDVIGTVEKSFKADSNGQTPISDFTADFFQRTKIKKNPNEMRGDGVASVRIATANTPLMFRFQYYRPYQQEIVSNGNSLWIYHPENREVILSDVATSYNHPGFNPERDRAVNFLQGLGRISKDFQINFASGMYDPAGNYILELNPRRSMLNIRKILLVVSKDAVISYKSGVVASATSTPQPRKHEISQPNQRVPFNTPAPFSNMPAFGGIVSDSFPILSTTVEDQEGNSTTMEFANIRVNTRLSEADFSFMIPPNVQTIKPSERNQIR